MPTAQIDDIDLLRQRLFDAEKQLGQAHKQLDSAQKKLADNHQLIDKLQSIIADLIQRKWGRSSEKHPGQFELSLFNEAELAAMHEPLEDDEHTGSDDSGTDGKNDQGSAEPSTSDDSDTGTQKPRKKPRPRVLPDHLERVKVT